ncbi:MAG: sigma-70 family RNA polymerase sigma factor [Tepidisphaeraceae bacterium]|jgi:RNA polymerase sigma factor (sigma-70 family)
MTQSDLLARYAEKKDAEAFAQIVTQYQRLVFATCRRTLRNPADVDDAVQETFLRLAQKASGLHTNLGGWLHACAANIAIDMNRRRTSRLRHESAVVPQAASESDPQRTLAELREHLDAAIERLAPDDRELIIQRFFVGRPQIELAQEAGVAPSTITHRLQQAVEALRGHLKALGCGIAATTVVATLLESEHASAAIPAMLTANIMKIGLTGVSGTALSVPLIMALLLLGTTVLIAVLIGIFLYMSSSPAMPVAQLPSSAIQPATVIPDLHGRVLAADGTPVSGATVLVALSEPSKIRIRNGKLEDDDARTPRAVTGPDGQYSLPQQHGKFLLQVIADAGYGQADQDTVAKNSDIQLMKWGRIQGRLMIGTSPGVGINLQTGSIGPARAEGPMPLSIVSRARTDADGNFTMERVVPGLILIERSFEQHSGSNTMICFGDGRTAQVTPGQTITVNFGGIGRPVVGKFVFPPGMNPLDYFINARAVPLRQSPATPRQDYFLDVDALHSFHINNVPAGEYRIHVFLQKVRGDRTAQPNRVTFTMPDVPDGVSEEPLVIPDIRLQ